MVFIRSCVESSRLIPCEMKLSDPVGSPELKISANRKFRARVGLVDFFSFLTMDHAIRSADLLDLMVQGCLRRFTRSSAPARREWAKRMVRLGSCRLRAGISVVDMARSWRFSSL